jgi:hypothetical protein
MFVFHSSTLEIQKQRFSMFVDVVGRGAPEELDYAGIVAER